MAAVRSLSKFGGIAFSMLFASGCLASGNNCVSRHEVQGRASPGKDHVYVIFVDSPVNMGHWGGIPQISQYVQSLGYVNITYYDPGRKNMARPLYPAEGSCSQNLAEIVRDIKTQDCAARVMMLGWSAGCLYLHDSLLILEQEGLCVESVVYVDSAWLEGHMQRTHPRNVDHIAAMYRPHTHLLKMKQHPPIGLPPTTVVYDLPVTWHIKVAMEHASLDAILAELTNVATSAPHSDWGEPSSSEIPPEPAAPMVTAKTKPRSLRPAL